MVNQQLFEFLTADDTVKNSREYRAISEVLSQMIRSGVFNLGAGYCISMSDMVRTALRHRGIESRLVECQLTLTYHASSPPDIRFIGFSDVVNPGEIDTHMVVVTDTEPAFLIDASISHRLSPNFPAIVEPLTVGKFDNQYDLVTQHYPQGNITVSYRQKLIQHVSAAYQESILERIKTDHRIFQNLGLLKMLIAIALTISTLNALRGAYDFYQVYYNENFWGPRTLQNIDERLDTLEDLLSVPMEQRRQFLEKTQPQ
jgi:hypothetical protein